MNEDQPIAINSELHLRVKTLQPATYEIDTTSQATVLELKEQLVALTNIPTDRQRLIFRGAVLQDTQGLASAHIEDGHTLHLVERPAGVPPSAATGQAHPHPQQQQNAQHHRINIGMIDMNGAIAASGGMNGFLQSMVGPTGHQQIQVVTHPPAGNQEGGPQVVQMISMVGGVPGQPPPHQLTALNNFLLHLDTAAEPSTLPPFSMVSRIGQVAADEAAFLELARASLQGVELPSGVEEFVRNMQVPPREPQSATGRATAPIQAGQQLPGAGGRGNPRDPRRNGLDGSQNQARPRPVSLSNDMLRLATLAVAQIARQSLRQAQATSLPAMATAVAAVQEQAFQDTVQAASIQEQARMISNSAYDLGSLLLELSLATANLANAAGGNAGPLISAQTGFLAGDGSHPHITNRVPSLLPPMMGAMPGTPQPMPAGIRLGPGGWPAAQQAAAAGRVGPPPPAGAVPGTTPPGVVPPQPGAPGPRPNAGGPTATAAAGGGMPPESMAQPPRTRGMDTASPLAHAYFNAITQDDETRSRHMRLPVRLADGSSFRIDMSPVVNAVETLILAAPPDVISRTLSNSLPVPMSGPENRGLRELMTGSQTDEQRRHIYLGLTQPILGAVMDHLQTYFQQLYRVTARQPGEEQAAIRPTRRAALRPVPSLTHPFAIVTNPARDILRTLPRQTMEFPGGQMQVDMVLEGSVEIPITAQDMQAHVASMAQAGLLHSPGATQNPPPQSPTTAAAPGLAGGQGGATDPTGAAELGNAQEAMAQRLRAALARRGAPPTSGQVPSEASTQPGATPLPGSASASGRPIQPTTTPSTDGARRASPDGARGASPAGMAAESMMFGNTGRPLNEDLQGGARQDGIVELTGGRTIDMGQISGMLGYPVRGPDGRTYHGRRPPSQEQAEEQRPPANDGGGPPPPAPGIAGTSSPVRSPGPTETPKGVATTSDRTESAGEASAGTSKDTEAPSAGGSQKAEGKDGARGLGVSLPSRKRTSSSGKECPHSAPQSGQGASGEGLGLGVGVNLNLLPTPPARDGKKQKLQDSPDTSSETANPDVADTDAGPSSQAEPGATSSRSQLQNDAQTGMPLANGGGGGLATMMNQMMQMPGIQEMMQSPEVEQLTSSPALAQMMGSLFNGQQGEGRAAGETQQAAGGGPQGQGVPDLTSLFQTMMPLAQQMLSGVSQGRTASQSQSQNDTAPGTSAVLPGSGSGSGDLPELGSLPEDDAQRWRNTIRADREKVGQDVDPKSLSSSYLLATNNKSARPSAVVDIADLD